ncbi:MAG: 4Fe-4S dicluster domain-containing protein, partial [Planctomycetota bacterium]|nr:4Fe-4S dicluster domain-containing protein [Planctomycetota bacterium]
FYDRVREAGVRYRRGNVSEIYSLPSPFGRGAGGEGLPNAPDENKITRLVVRAEDTLLCEPLQVEADLVVLAAGMVPRPETNELAGLLKITRGADGFLLEAHPKLRPVDTATDGIFLAGCCQGPKDITDTLAQASAAAAKAMIPLSMGKVMGEAATPKIDEKACAGCRICEAMCAYGALVFDEKRGVMTLNQVLCKGCGSCGSACPSSAISPEHFKDEQVLAQVDAVAT